MQSKINKYNDIIFEWILYNQFDEIKKIDKNDSITTYSAIWKDGPLYYNKKYSNYARNSNKKVTLKYLHNSQNSIDFLINEVNKYSKIVNKMIFQIYGISQNPYTNDYIFVLNNYFWKSGNKKIDNFIQKMQLKMNDYNDIVFEWILYNQFDKIKEISKNGSITMKNYSEMVNTMVFQIYGISQNPYTNDYIFVLNNYFWKSGNKKIDNFIQEMQLKIKDYNDVVFEWISYNQFDEIKEISENDSITIYSAIWKDGPLYNNQYINYIRDSNKEVTLKYLHNSQDSIDSLINEATKYSEMVNKMVFQIYGISQNPYANNYILVLKNLIWASGNEKIDNFIQEMQLKINKYNDTIFEWILYNQFDEIKEINKNDSITIYSAIWKDGPLYNNQYINYIRDSNKKVTLRYLHNSQDSIDSLIKEV
ncbi:unnamed protein product [Rhizophagus irregularis]|nr:unnamed protein product [Rhizophagus irregularis]